MNVIDRKQIAERYLQQMEVVKKLEKEFEVLNTGEFHRDEYIAFCEKLDSERIVFNTLAHLFVKSELGL